MKTKFEQELFERGITRMDAAKASGFSYATIHMHYSGKRTISADSAIIYEKTLGIPRKELRPDLWQDEN